MEDPGLWHPGTLGPCERGSCKGLHAAIPVRTARTLSSPSFQLGAHLHLNSCASFLCRIRPPCWPPDGVSAMPVFPSPSHASYPKNTLPLNSNLQAHHNKPFAEHISPAHTPLPCSYCPLCLVGCPPFSPQQSIRSSLYCLSTDFAPVSGGHENE